MPVKKLTLLLLLLGFSLLTLGFDWPRPVRIRARYGQVATRFGDSALRGLVRDSGGEFICDAPLVFSASPEGSGNQLFSAPVQVNRQPRGLITVQVLHDAGLYFALLDDRVGRWIDPLLIFPSDG